jgi:hypothetical protein
MGQKTAQELLALKADWLQDGTWDLHATEGFEDHCAELKDFEEKAAKAYSFKQTCDVEMKAIALGLPGNTKLAGYVLNLESRLAEMEITAGQRSLDERPHNRLSVAQMERWINAMETVATSEAELSQPTFRGAVTYIGDGVLQQKVNRNGQTVVHPLARLDPIPAVGDVVEVRYHFGKATVATEGPVKGMAR